ncbi:complex I assembly factor ACAD9, mitochondrial-like isoform X2 [Oppia nitens]|uniref:complex I assembly factor ACAD9, mitochondrial-like isoform X2 n=1 Tax=Oppia nitens TaxID=1686743 RepID=UPI0023DA014B|nr:complex I assembly factor ACAD9, mitochondrial-like isoform X2 [Oppia nitens]
MTTRLIQSTVRDKRLAAEMSHWCRLLANSGAGGCVGGHQRLMCCRSIIGRQHQQQQHRHSLCRQLSTTAKSSPASASDTTANPSQPMITDEVFEERRYSGETRFSMPKALDIKPIQSLGLRSTIEKIIKYESFIERSFLGEFDKDFLSFPILLKTRQEFIEMTDQYEMVRQTFAKMRKDDQTLETLAFKSLYELSVSEMMFVFEAIGASNQQRLSSFGTVSAEDRRRLNPINDINRLLSTTPENQLTVESLNEKKTFIEEVVPLIIHNALTYYAVYTSSNVSLRDEILETKPKIGFAFCEPNDHLGSLPYIHWESQAKLSNSADSWLISGSKGRILKDNYDYYMVFCRSDEFPEESDIKRINQYGIVTLLVPKDQVIIENDGTDSYGFEYQRIRFNDLLLSREKHELIKSEEKATLALNVKACGQLASSAIILGILKQLLRNTYNFVVNERVGLSECDIIQKILSESTQKIYAIESMLYLTAAMFDSFETGSDMTLESIAVKTKATEFGYDVIKNLRSIYGSRYPVSSTAHDLINVFDSFLDCSINNRMYLALRGVRMHGQWNHDHIRRMRLSPLYPVYMLKSYLKSVRARRDNISLDLDLVGYCHPNLRSAAEWLEYCVKKLDFVTQQVLIKHGKNIINKQQELDRLATMAIDIYMVTATTSRASHAMCTGLRNSDIDKEVAINLSMESFLNTTKLVDELFNSGDTNSDHRHPMVHNRNVKYDGYFAMPTIDRIV